MKEYLNKGIKEVIKQFPEIENVLNEYNIGCAPCNVGTCLLKDIVEIHNLSPEDEGQLMAKIAKIIYPDRRIEIPKIKRKEKPASREIKYSPPMGRLVNEHKLIKDWAALIPMVIDSLDISSEQGKQLILDGVDFIRSYADKYHHAKEEDILFKYFDNNLDIIKTMHEDHEKARGYVRNILDALEKKNAKVIVENLNAYRELLIEHIKREDEILYPWMDRNLSVKQIGELFSKFDKVDKIIDKEVIERCEKFVIRLKEKMQNQKKEVRK